jgi:hypothetical protein
MLPDLIIRQHFIYKIGFAAAHRPPAGRTAPS